MGSVQAFSVGTNLIRLREGTLEQKKNGLEGTSQWQLDQTHQERVNKAGWGNNEEEGRRGVSMAHGQISVRREEEFTGSLSSLQL